jgi:hypothetical protein
MSAIGGPNIVEDGLVTLLDVANIKSFRGEPTVNLKTSAQDAHFNYSTGQYVFHGLETTGEFAGWYKITATSTSVNRLIMGLNGINTLANTIYTASIEWISPNNSLSFEVNGNQGAGVPTLIPGQPNRYSRTFTKNASNGGQHFYLRSANGVVGSITNGIIYYRNIQWEQKPYVTAFTLTSRGSTVATGGGLFDMTYNTTNGQLFGTTYDSNNLGSLDFDGTDDYYIITQPNITTSPNQWTISLWMNPGNQSSRFLTPQSNGIDQYLTYDPVNQRVQIAVATSADTNERARSMSSNTVLRDKWTFLTISLDNLTIKMYSNGILRSTFTETLSIANWTANWVVGQRGNATNWYLGKMSNLMVHNRVLSDDEVLQNYNSTKFRYL